jgi:ATP-dependent DNA helicase RecG
MDDHELEALLGDLESDRVERKASPADGDKIRQAICAFANDLPNHRRPGVVFVGVDPDGSCGGLIITDDLLLNLANIRSEGSVLPFPTLTVQKRLLSGCEVAVVIVEPADAPPVRYRSRVYVRVGPSTRMASAEEERRLSEKRRAGDLPFDIRPVPSSTLNDIDLDSFRTQYLPFVTTPEVLAENERSIEEQLASVRFATAARPPIPTALGILVSGRDPRQFVPGAYVQFLRIEGTELTDPIKDQKEIDGRLADVLRLLDETLRVHIEVASDIVGTPIEKRRPDYPVAALQQLVRNAVLHRTYESTNAPVRISWFSDRIEIQNPGGPYGQVTRENFARPGVTDYRNPHLAEAMKNLGYVQRFGAGIPIARKELLANGNPPPEFEVGDTNVLVTVRKSR